jgi:hypothetical protein
MRSVHAVGTLALSIIVFSLALTAAFMGTRHDGLYAVPGRAESVATAAGFHAPPPTRF